MGNKGILTANPKKAQIHRIACFFSEKLVFNKTNKSVVPVSK